VLPIPALPGEDDDALRKAVTDAVMEVVKAGDAYRGAERRAFVEAELKKIKDDPRFSRDRPFAPASAAE
jgi:hypothetical protein